MVEFALALPLLITLFYGVIEITRYVLIAQKTEKLAYSVANVTAQESVALKSNLNAVMGASSDIMQPYGTGANSRIIISSIYRQANAGSTVYPAKVNWQYGGGGTLSAASAIGTVGAAPNMPGGFTFDERENVIAAEVFYRFDPLLTNRWFGTTTIYRVAYFKPRLSALTAAPV
jgi:Flp pilus assembly protein TadG